tara:strand:- start:419 stop:1282 length:864 start_codon:yes stop_codon:yes gene_type:complete
MIERIYIPTVRRANNQITFNNLPKELQERVVMVVEPSERHLYDYPCEYLEIPEKLVGTWTQLAETRLFIHKHAGAIKYCVADDDIKIRRRNAKYWTGQSNMEKSKRDATAEEMLDMYETVDKWFDESAIGVVGLSDAGSPPSSKEYEDTKDVYSYVFYDGRMLSEVINDMDICSLRIAEDVLFLYEVLSRGINTRKSTEWMYDNRSMVQKDLSDTREVWIGMFKNVEDRPDNYYQSDAHYDAMRYIQSKYPHGVKIFEKDGKMKNRKYWKKVYNPKYSDNSENFLND